jgi:4-hydroxy-3-polyprenylbenzoate decarboxylase
MSLRKFRRISPRLLTRVHVIHLAQISTPWSVAGCSGHIPEMLYLRPCNFSRALRSPLQSIHAATHHGRFSTACNWRSDQCGPSISTGCRPKRIVIGITGATGTVYAVRMLEVLRELGVETHLIISKWALTTLKYETDQTEANIHKLATRVYTARDMTAPIASGSFIHDGMIIVPCSMKTLAAVRIGYCDDLISRAADVTLKERRTLLLVPRETPLSDIHLENMLSLRRMGAVIFPPMPAFYTRPKSLDDIINQSVGRILDSFGIHTEGFERWNGVDWQKKSKETCSAVKI